MPVMKIAEVTFISADRVRAVFHNLNADGFDSLCPKYQFTALRYFTLDGTDHADHKEHGSMIRRYIIWRNRHAGDRLLRAVVDGANVA